MRQISTIIVAFFFSYIGNCQEDIQSFKDVFLKGEHHGHLRSSSMTTINNGVLEDYFTSAIGGALAYQTAVFYGFQFGVKGIYSYRLFGSDLLKTDSVSGKQAKWESELYDINRPGEYLDLDRLEELYIAYHFGTSLIRYGKIDINTSPLLLRRDGRMKPFVYRGLWAEIQEFQNQEITIAWINGVSPRGMTDWFSINEAVGLLNNGFQYNGEKAQYHKAVQSNGIVIGQYAIQTGAIKTQLWNYYFHEMMNITWFQSDIKKENWFAGLQYAHQFSDATQNQLNYAERIYQPDETANVFAAQFGIIRATNPHTEHLISIAALRALNTGRFIFPRELGRENFYVSQPRSWLDGFGNTNMIQIRHTVQKNQLKIDSRIVYVDNPGLLDSEFNKYKREDYIQFTFLTNYEFDEFLEGLDLTLLYVGRNSKGIADVPLKSQFYQTNFHHLNLILNIHF